MKKVLWLDLEDTVIEPVLQGWGNVSLIPRNILKIKSFMEDWQPDELSIFSFAIHNEFEKKSFSHWVKPWLEDQFGMKIISIPTVDGEIKSACCNDLKLAKELVTFHDMIEFWGKQISFRLLIKQMNNVDVVLFDDAVVDEVFSFPNVNTAGRIFNIDTFKL